MPPATPANPANPVCSGDIWLLIQQIAMGAYPWWYPDAAKSQAIDFFIYGSDFLPLPLSASLTQNINIDGSSAFVIVSTQLVETDTGDTTFLAQRPILCTVLDTGSGRVLSNIPIHVDNWFGTAQRPYVWPVPKIMAPNATMSVTLQNLEATARNVRVAFSGFKIFNFTPTA
jgi:hypothetical protein